MIDLKITDTVSFQCQNMSLLNEIYEQTEKTGTFTNKLVKTGVIVSSRVFSAKIKGFN